MAVVDLRERSPVSLSFAGSADLAVFTGRGGGGCEDVSRHSLMRVALVSTV